MAVGVGIFIARIKSSREVGLRSISITIFSSGNKSKNNFACFFSSLSNSKPNASKTSSAQVTGVAPWWSNLFVPFEFGEKIDPGTTNKSLLYSVVRRAVIRVPDLSSASIIRVALEIPAISLFLFPKPQRVALNSGSNSDIRQPPFLIISSANLAFVFGYIASRDNPEPGKTRTFNPTDKAFLWAIASIPIARPETITIG